VVALWLGAGALAHPGRASPAARVSAATTATCIFMVFSLIDR